MSVPAQNSPEQHPEPHAATHEGFQSAPILANFNQIIDGTSVVIQADSLQQPGFVEEFVFVKSNAPDTEAGAPEYFWRTPSIPRDELVSPDMVPIQILGACLSRDPPHYAEAGIVRKGYPLLIGVIAAIDVSVLDLDPNSIPAPRVHTKMTPEEQYAARQQSAEMAWWQPGRPNGLIAQLMIGPVRSVT